MTQSAPKPCSQCHVLVTDGTSRCAAHKVVAGSFADERRGTRQERGYGAAWDRIRVRVMRRDGGLCQVCKGQGLLVEAKEVDHVVPKAQGGTDVDANLQAICTPCHRAKTAREAGAGRGWGGRISGADQRRTGLLPTFLRARVSSEGGG